MQVLDVCWNASWTSSSAYIEWKSKHVTLTGSGRCLGLMFTLPVKCRWEKRCWRKWVSAEKSRSCSLSTLMRTTVLMWSRPLKFAQKDSTSPETYNTPQGDFQMLYILLHLYYKLFCCYRAMYCPIVELLQVLVYSLEWKQLCCCISLYSTKYQKWIMGLGMVAFPYSQNMKTQHK